MPHQGNVEYRTRNVQGRGTWELGVPCSIFDISFTRFYPQVGDFGCGREPPWTLCLKLQCVLRRLFAGVLFGCGLAPPWVDGSASADLLSATVFRRWTRALYSSSPLQRGFSKGFIPWAPFRAGEGRFVIGHGPWDWRQRYGRRRLETALAAALPIAGARPKGQTPIMQAQALRTFRTGSSSPSFPNDRAALMWADPTIRHVGNDKAGGRDLRTR